MPTNLDALYQELILDHNRRPRNYRVMDGATSDIEGNNPMCGDTLHLWLRMNGDLIEDISFQGSGCAISKASASMMTAAVRGHTRGEALALTERFHAMVTGQPPADPSIELGKLEAFAGVARFPQRVKCASMAWHALRSALVTPAAPVTPAKAGAHVDL